MLNRQAPRPPEQGGFTLIEITIAILILTVAVLGIAQSAGQMITPAISAELEFQALSAVEDRLAFIRLEPRYGVLDSLFAGTESSIAGNDELTRVTAVTRTRQDLGGGKTLDYTTIVVTVNGARLSAPISRKLVMAAP